MSHWFRMTRKAMEDGTKAQTHQSTSNEQEEINVIENCNGGLEWLTP